MQQPWPEPPKTWPSASHVDVWQQPQQQDFSQHKRRHDDFAESHAADDMLSRTAKRLRIGGGGNPWCARAPPRNPAPLPTPTELTRALPRPPIVRSAEHSPMSQPPHTSFQTPHPGLARSWAGAQPPHVPASPFPAGMPQQGTFLPPQQHHPFVAPAPPFGSGPVQQGMPPSTFSAAAAAAAMCPSLQPHYQHQQSPMHQHHIPPPPQLPPSAGAPSPAHVSPILGPQLTTPPPASWSSNARDVLDSPAECPPSHYSNINALLAHLHTERVNAGARQRWLDDDDDDEDL